MLNKASEARAARLIERLMQVRESYDDSPTYEWSFLQQQEKRFFANLKRLGLSNKEIYLRLQDL